MTFQTPETFCKIAINFEKNLNFKKFQNVHKAVINFVSTPAKLSFDMLKTQNSYLVDTKKYYEMLVTA